MSQFIMDILQNRSNVIQIPYVANHAIGLEVKKNVGLFQALFNYSYYRLHDDQMKLTHSYNH